MRSRRPFTLVLVCLLALLLRLPLLNGSLWMDEAAQAMESSRSLSEQTNIGEDYQPPLFHIIVHFFLQVSREEWWIRLPSLLAGIGTIAVFYLLIEEKFSQKTGLLASMVLVSSPFHIFFSQELRPYSLAAFWACLSWYILVSRRIKQRRWIWYVIVTTLGMYTMYLYPFNILAQLVFVFLEQKKAIKSVIISLCCVGVFFLPWLPSFLNQLHIGTHLTIALPGWSQAVATPQLKVLPLTVAKFLVGQVQFHGHLLLVSIVGILLALFSVLILKNVRSKQIRMFLIWFVVPLFTAWLVSFVVPVIQPKRVLFILPAFALLIAWVSQKSTFGKWLLSALILIQCLSTVIYWKTPALHREDWKTLVHTLEAQSTGADAALFSFTEPFAPWQWYSSGKITPISTGTVYLTASFKPASVSSQLTHVSRIYLFEYLRDLTDPQHRLDTLLSNNGFIPSGQIDAQTIGFVRFFARMK